MTLYCCVIFAYPYLRALLSLAGSWCGTVGQPQEALVQNRPQQEEAARCAKMIELARLPGYMCHILNTHNYNEL